MHELKIERETEFELISYSWRNIRVRWNHINVLKIFTYMHNVIAIIVVNDWLCWLTSQFWKLKEKKQRWLMLRNVKK